MKNIIRFFSEIGYIIIIETNTNPKIISKYLDNYKYDCELKNKEKKIGDFLNYLIEKDVDFKAFDKQEYSIYF